MHFLLLDTTEAQNRITKALTNTLVEKRVLWLVCGGSSIAAQAQIMQNLPAENLKNLTILPMDERYGPPGHSDSNYQQLRDAGFDARRAKWKDVLERDLPLTETVSYYSELISDAQSEADYILGVFGLGADGHTAGVLPGTPATSDDEASVVGYVWTDFTRMTLTPRELVKTDEAYVLAYGANKKDALQRLQKNDESIQNLPAILLYHVPKVEVYNDQIETKETAQ